MKKLPVLITNIVIVIVIIFFVVLHVTNQGDLLMCDKEVIEV